MSLFRFVGPDEIRIAMDWLDKQDAQEARDASSWLKDMIALSDDRRAQFAAAALSGLVRLENVGVGTDSPWLAVESFRIADAMVAEMAKAKALTPPASEDPVAQARRHMRDAANHLDGRMPLAAKESIGWAFEALGRLPPDLPIDKEFHKP